MIITRRRKIRTEFTEYVPEKLRSGILYISIPFSTASHLCPCGCGQRVVTPIQPTKWSLTWDGESVSLYPSIGNWTFSCMSHYWIKKNKIIWISSQSERKTP